MHTKKMDWKLALKQVSKRFQLVEEEKKINVSFENTEFINCCMDQMA